MVNQGNDQELQKHKSFQRPQSQAKAGLRTRPSCCMPGSEVFPLQTARRSGIAGPLPHLAMLSSLRLGRTTPAATCFLNPPMDAHRRLEPANQNAGPPGNLNRAGRLLEPHCRLADPWCSLPSSGPAACAPLRRLLWKPEPAV